MTTTQINENGTRIRIGDRVSIGQRGKRATYYADFQHGRRVLTPQSSYSNIAPITSTLDLHSGQLAMCAAGYRAGRTRARGGPGAFLLTET